MPFPGAHSEHVVPFCRPATHQLRSWPGLAGSGSARLGPGCGLTWIISVTVGLGKDFDHWEHHECMFGADQVCAELAVQEDHEQLCVHQQILLDKECPGDGGGNLGSALSMEAGAAPLRAHKTAAHPWTSDFLAKVLRCHR